MYSVVHLILLLTQSISPFLVSEFKANIQKTMASFPGHPATYMLKTISYDYLPIFKMMYIEQTLLFTGT